MEQIVNIIDHLTKKMHLEYTFGFIKLERHIYKDNSVKIVPVDLSFGIPLGSEELNDQVSKSIVEKELFSPDKIKQNSLNMKQMCNEFLSFIDTFLDQGLRMDEGNYPTTSIVFDGKEIRKIK